MSSDDEARDGHGRWTSGGGGAAHEANKSDTGTVSPKPSAQRINPEMTHEALLTPAQLDGVGMNGSDNPGDFPGIKTTAISRGSKMVVHGTPAAFKAAAFKAEMVYGNSADVSGRDRMNAMNAGTAFKNFKPRSD